MTDSHRESSFMKFELWDDMLGQEAVIMNNLGPARSFNQVKFSHSFIDHDNSKRLSRQIIRLKFTSTPLFQMFRTVWEGFETY